MPELRQNIATGEWVILATERAKRPEDFEKKEEKKEIPEFKEKCHFCPSNEHLTPPPIFQIPEKGSWDLRVVPNKFSALVPDISYERFHHDTFRKATGFGFHYVIIETKAHNKFLPFLSLKEVENVVEAYHRSFVEIASHPNIEFVIPFKNHGEGAGTSLEHPHSQIIGLPVFPEQVRGRMEEAIRFYDREGKCVFCHMIEMERKEEVRIVYENDSFIGFIPFAAFSPFHFWLFPKKHEAVFSEIKEKEKGDLALALKTVLGKLSLGLKDPDYNLVIRSGPVEAPRIKYFHWYISIVPRLGKAAGFELGSGMYINTGLPEESAKFLRNVKWE